MSILIAGAGPAGLATAIALKTVDNSLRITVRERRAESELPGWGIALGPRHRLFLLTRTPITPVIGAEIRVNGELLGRVDRFENRGVARAHLLRGLRGVCKAMRIPVEYEAAVSSDDLQQHELVIAADGVGSVLRQRHARELGVNVSVGRSHYMWLGVHTDIRALRMDVRTTEHGPFLLESYPYDGQHCTAIAVAMPETIQQAGLGQLTANEQVEYLSNVFREELAGAALEGNDASQWRPFETVTTTCAMHGNLLLVGDALHTAHFSMGLGTRMALEDAMAVAAAFLEVGGFGGALGERFWQLRQDPIREAQAQARDTANMFERAVSGGRGGPCEERRAAAVDYYRMIETHS